MWLFLLTRWALIFLRAGKGIGFNVTKTIHCEVTNMYNLHRDAKRHWSHPNMASHLEIGALENAIRPSCRVWTKAQKEPLPTTTRCPSFHSSMDLLLGAGRFRPKACPPLCLNISVDVKSASECNLVLTHDLYMWWNITDASRAWPSNRAKPKDWGNAPWWYTISDSGRN